MICNVKRDGQIWKIIHFTFSCISNLKADAVQLVRPMSQFDGFVRPFLHYKLWVRNRPTFLHVHLGC